MSTSTRSVGAASTTPGDGDDDASPAPSSTTGRSLDTKGPVIMDEGEEGTIMSTSSPVDWIIMVAAGVGAVGLIYGLYLAFRKDVRSALALGVVTSASGSQARIRYVVNAMPL